nr:EAL domain-containing protein [Neobacillus sp. Marseille-Q6967]
MSIKRKLPLIFTVLVFLILLLNNVFQYIRSKNQLLDYNEQQISLITKEVSFQVENSTGGALYVEDLLARELRTASLAIVKELPADYHDVTNEQLVALAEELGVSHITLLAETDDDIIGVKSSDPEEIDMSTKEWGYWYDAFKQLFALKPVKVEEGLSLPNYWSGPIEIASSDPKHVDKWGYYYDGTTNYIINPYFRDKVVLEYEQRFGPGNTIENFTKEEGILELTVFNPKNFGEKEEIVHLNGNSFIRISARPVWYGQYNYRNIAVDKGFIEKAVNTKRAQSYREHLNGKSVMKTFVPVFEENKEDQPYVIGLVYHYGLIENQLYQELIVHLILSLVIMIIVLLVSFVFSNSITRPIGYIVEQVKEIAEGNFGKTLNLNRKDELGLLTENVNALSHHLRNYVNDLKNSKELIEYQAYHDPLTGLLNRRFLIKKLQEIVGNADRLEQTISVLFIDIDRFKHVNDSLGHNKGDQLLQLVSERIKRSIPEENNIITRQGGDEFILLMLNSSLEVTKAAAEALVNSLKQPYLLDDNEIYLGASCGISLYPQHTRDLDNLVIFADIAMYAAKKMGGNKVIVYNEQIHDSNPMRPQIESRLRKAIEQEKIEVYYQPKINVLTNQIFGAEALVRWTDEELGFVPPDLFIPIAEDTGLIQPIWEIVMKSACKQVSYWNQKLSQSLNISVNFSARQFLEPRNMVNKIEEVLAETGLPPENFEIEITESILINHSEELVKTLQSLKNMGISISIDDFGTGYSSLSYLKDLPISTLKIDKSFIQNINENFGNSEIPVAVINLARGLHLNVIAEGVETDYQKEFLLSKNCVEMQGYLFSKPLNHKDFEDFLKKGI